MPLVLVGVKMDRSWLAVPDASGASNRSLVLDIIPPSAVGRSATKAKEVASGNAKANTGCSMAVANAHTSPDSRRRVQSNRAASTG